MFPNESSEQLTSKTNAFVQICKVSYYDVYFYFNLRIYDFSMEITELNVFLLEGFCKSDRLIHCLHHC